MVCFKNFHGAKLAARVFMWLVWSASALLACLLEIKDSTRKKLARGTACARDAVSPNQFAPRDAKGNAIAHRHSFSLIVWTLFFLFSTKWPK